MEAASGERLARAAADGGAVGNAWLMQFQADVLGRPVVVPEVAETTALGAAYLAGIGTALWTLEQVARDVAGGRPLRAADGRAERERAARTLAARRSPAREAGAVRNLAVPNG